MEKYLKLLRVKHYIKNILVIVPLVFSKNFFNTNKLIPTLIGMLAFCFCSSTVYIINDIKDVEKDRKHPKKKERPIASGKVSISKAIMVASCLFCFSIGSILIIDNNFNIDSVMAIFYLVLYLILNVAYSFGLKDRPIVDITILVSGFLIRILFGGIVTRS